MVFPMKIYVGNLPWRVDDAELTSMFEPFGHVTSASVLMDRETGRSRGFGFVEMGDDDAKKAISELDGNEIEGRGLRVNEAQPRH